MRPQASRASARSGNAIDGHCLWIYQEANSRRKLQAIARFLLGPSRRPVPEATIGALVNWGGCPPQAETGGGHLFHRADQGGAWLRVRHLGRTWMDSIERIRWADPRGVSESKAVPFRSRQNTELSEQRGEIKT
jgi:hypothetical protein